MLFLAEGTDENNRLSNITLKNFKINQEGMRASITNGNNDKHRMIKFAYVENVKIENIKCKTFGMFSAFIGSADFHIKNNTIESLCAFEINEHSDAHIGAWNGCFD